MGIKKTGLRHNVQHTGGPTGDPVTPLFALHCDADGCDWHARNVPTIPMVRQLAHLHETDPDGTPSVTFDLVDAMRERRGQARPQEYMGVRVRNISEPSQATDAESTATRRKAYMQQCGMTDVVAAERAATAPDAEGSASTSVDGPAGEMTRDFSGDYAPLGWLKRHQDGTVCVGHRMHSPECKAHGPFHAEGRCARCKTVLSGAEWHNLVKVWKAHQCGAPVAVQGGGRELPAGRQRVAGVPTLKKEFGRAGKRKVHPDGSVCTHRGATHNRECKGLGGYVYKGACAACDEPIRGSSVGRFADAWEAHKKGCMGGALEE